MFLLVHFWFISAISVLTSFVQSSKIKRFRQLLLRTTQPFIAVLKSTPFFSIAIQCCTYYNGIHGTLCVKETRIHVPPLISSTVTVHPPLSTPPFTPRLSPSFKKPFRSSITSVDNSENLKELS